MARPDIRRPAAVAFDVNETLFSLEPVRGALVDAGFPERALEWWFAQTLRDGCALTVLGEFRTFGEIAAYHLAAMAARSGVEAPGGWVDTVLGELPSLPPHDDARPALEAAAAAGVGIYALTNGSARTTEAMLAHAELDDLVPRVISIDEVSRWKPDPAPYRYAAEVAGVPPERMALVAVHSWDTHGAARAGLTTGWARRLERLLPPWVVQPDVVGDSVDEVVRGLLDLAD